MTAPTRREFLATGALAAADWWAAATRAHATSRRPAPAWIDRREFGPFQCAAAFPLASLDPVFDEMSLLEHELQRTLGLPPAAATVEVFLLADEAAHRELLEQLYPRVPYRRALYVQRDRRAAVYAYQHPELAIDLRHECTHALLHANLPSVPLWLDEGLAEYFEMPEAQRPSDHPHLPAVTWNMRLGMFRTIESLEAADDLSDMGGIEYRFSWAWVHFLLHGPVAAHRTLVQFVAEIRRGSPAGRLSDRLHAALPAADERMAQHFLQWRRADVD